MDILFFFIMLFSIVALVVGLINPNWVIRWGNAEPSRKLVLKVYGITVVLSFILMIVTLPEVENNDSLDSTKESNEITVPDSSDKEVEEEGVEGEELFGDLYTNLVNKEYSDERESISRKAKALGFVVSPSGSSDSIKIVDNHTSDNDYIFITFKDTEHDDSLRISSMVSYFYEKEELEVSLANYSPDDKSKYDNLYIKKIGGSESKVDSIEEQIVFLNTTKNEYKVEREKLAKTVAENTIDEPIRLEFTVTHSLEEGKLLVSINTNLPDGTQGQVNVSSSTSDYSGSDKFKVNKGAAQAGYFSMQGDSLPSGSYKVSVTTPLSEHQPDSALVLLGDNYENYIGDIFVDGDRGRSIGYSFQVDIP